MKKTTPQIRWRLGILAAAALAALALYPQIDLRLSRGYAWQGSYAYIDTDEVAYSAYVNALIDGRPRRNDPYTGRDDLPGKPEPESLFSIQFLPAYLTAGIARALKSDVASVFTLLMCLGAAASTVAVFWLLNHFSGDPRIGAVGAIAVLCLGTLASGEGAVRYLTGSNAAYNYLPFLRRYIPLIPFPLFFLFCGLTWRSVIDEDRKRSALFASAAGVVFSCLIYSYFFLWTAAAAWFICFALLLILVRPDQWRTTIHKLLLVPVIAAVAFVPYAYLLSNRSGAMDAAQLLLKTRKPDLFRPPELIGFILIAILLFHFRARLSELKTFPGAFIGACAIMPAVVFNQQILTGYSLQPIHYEQFIANYVAVLALVLSVSSYFLTAKKFSSPIKALPLFVVAVACFGWAVIETRIAVRVYSGYNEFRDEGWAVSNRLRQLHYGIKTAARTPPVVLSTVDLLADDLPTATPYAVLWARHMHVFAGVDRAENKRRFCQLMYYTGVSPEEIREGLNAGEFYYTVALFGWDRANFNLTAEPRPVAPEEIEAEVQLYSTYVKEFDAQQAGNPALSFVVTEATDEPSFENLDQWYVRSDAERIGAFCIYKVQLKNSRTWRWLDRQGS